MLTKDTAICIRAIDYSETSQIVTLFTRENGKVDAIAKGAKRAKSAFGGAIEMLSCGSVVFTAGAERNLATLTEFEQSAATGVRDYFALNCALFAAELVTSLTDHHDPHPELFDYLCQFLDDIRESRERTHSLALLILFQLTLLREIGLQPVLRACANCKTPFGVRWAEAFFSSSANGLICGDCEASFPDKIKLAKAPAGCLANMKEIAKAKEGVLDEVEKVLVRHFTELLHRPPKMTKYILKK
jgi:DNA repair protein RecO (recombination protein O)